MGAKSQDAMVEGLTRILKSVGTKDSSELLAGAGASELEALFLAELRSRRERLARWMQLIQEEVRRETAERRVRAPRRLQCRSRASRPAR